MKAVILAGGEGKRLWPLSRKRYPKQFLKIGENDSLFRETVDRLLPIFGKDNIIIVTNKQYEFHIKDEIKDIGIEHILLEPCAKNTAPAILLSLVYIEKELKGENETLFVCPSDHIIYPQKEFKRSVNIAKESSDKGYIVTFGISPKRAETGYGYIKSKEKINGFYSVDSFHEKPDKIRAEKYLKEDGYFWNSGMFMFSSEKIMKEFNNFFPIPFHYKSYNEFIRNFDKLPSASFDKTILEKSLDVAMVPASFSWSDVGSWDSIWDIMKKDEQNNVKFGKDIITLNTENTLLLSRNRLISAIGVEDLLIIETEDALLVAKRGDAERTKEIVAQLLSEGRIEAIQHKTIYRPWGSYTLMDEGPEYKVKKVIINPGGVLMMQIHHHRSEHWTVIRGTLKATVDGEEVFLHQNESAYASKSIPHKLENPGKISCELIEIQSGEYLKEDDVVIKDE